MPTKKSATKTSSRATLNLPIFGNGKKNKKQEKEVKKAIKKSNPKTIMVSLLLIIVGFIIGAGAYFIVCKNDTFEVVGKDQITLTLDEKYEERGAKIIEFGKDISENVIIETNLELNEDKTSKETGTFYVKYTVDSIKYGKLFKIQKIKLVTFVDSSEIDELEGE